MLCFVLKTKKKKFYSKLAIYLLNKCYKFDGLDTRKPIYLEIRLINMIISGVFAVWFHSINLGYIYIVMRQQINYNS